MFWSRVCLEGGVNWLKVFEGLMIDISISLLYVLRYLQESKG